jgi:hypothetical protein
MSKDSAEADLRREFVGIFLPFPAELAAVARDKSAILSERLPKCRPTYLIERWLERELKLVSYGKMFSRLLRRRKRDVKYYISPRARKAEAAAGAWSFAVRKLESKSPKNRMRPAAPPDTGAPAFKEPLT